MDYYEEQHFTGGWRLFWMVFMLAPGAVALPVLLPLTAAGAVNLMPAILIVVAVELGLLALLLLILRTPVVVRVTSAGIHVRVPPFIREEIPAADVTSMEEVSSGLFRRYGAGVGKRYGDRLARFTVGNDAGIVLTRSNGWRIVIGSKRSAELAAAVHDLIDVA